MVGFSEGRVLEGFVCITEVRVAVVEGIAHAHCAINMLEEFRKALLKSPATINAASGCMVSSLHIVQ